MTDPPNFYHTSSNRCFIAKDNMVSFVPDCLCPQIVIVLVSESQTLDVGILQKKVLLSFRDLIKTILKAVVRRSMENVIFHKDVKLLILVPNIHISAVPTFGVPVNNSYRFADKLLSGIFILNEILVNKINNRQVFRKKHQLP